MIWSMIWHIPNGKRIMSFTIATYNVWVGSRNDPERLALLGKITNRIQPDILGVQEATNSHLGSLLAALPSRYKRIGEGREGGRNGEYSAILLNTKRFELLGSGTKWLSDTPDKPSKLEKSYCLRIFTWTKIRDRQTGRVHCHINTHLDHGLEEIRVAQARMLLDFTKTIDVPVSITGDFNVYEKEGASYQTMIDGGFDDAKFLSPVRSPIETTWQNFGRTDDFPGVIDYCFLEHGAFKVNSYTIHHSKIGDFYASDHNPVVVDVELL